MAGSSASGTPALAVRGLRVEFGVEGRRLVAANNVTFSVAPASALGIVGESGSGKSVTLRALCGLVPSPGRVVDGEIEVEGRARPAGSDLSDIRGSSVAMIFQDPGSSLNPVLTVGAQLTEVLTEKLRYTRQAARTRAIELLEQVELPSAEARLKAYPHELSGGMRQRVMIALALACEPRVLLADEPTTALDVTTQEQILCLLLRLQAETGMAIVFVTHDLGVVAELCDDVAVMYAGCIVERGPVDAITKRPRHPYSRALLDAVPDVYVRQLPEAIPGETPDLAALPPGCPFQPRCSFARSECSSLDMRVETLKPSACPFVDATAERSNALVGAS